ncbi:hypothetical protein SGFS_089950 [Streptomyces graminofaciens]|uniref:Chitin-binding type-4 domain-containing protein n=1 Tax=Streptomyces graminofaciens TaxID=68212 RepID=A0ABM8HMH8_9ACTN|nr:lytic polysaccharide monooxygenase [Streptomyces graminofaciens]BBC37701.1 hypothetical protein SGFS_089950 [Streptomyces graminofaciens]
MPAAHRKAAAVAAVTALGMAPIALTAFAAAPAAAHGSLGDPVSRVAQCYAEGPERPSSAACRAAVTAGGTQALYDWNGVRIGDANGRHQQLIPDGRLCGANSEAFKGLDLARADWPATSVRAGSYTFRYRVTAPHKGTFKVYVTKAGYDPSQPLAWDDLDLARPVATSTDPVASDGFYTFGGTLPERSGRHLLYAVWQRSDSPEAFYSCSDVTFGSAGGSSATPSASASSASAPAASAPSDQQIEDGADKSTVGHGGHDDASPTAAPRPKATSREPVADGGDAGTDVEPEGAKENLAETGGDGMTPYVAIGGAGVLAVGSSTLFAVARRRTARGRH